MKRWLAIVCSAVLLFFAGTAEAWAKDVNVRGYTRRDGTYVKPHVRSAPDGISSNNYSYPGNTNPYTGKVAPGRPESYQPTTPSAPAYKPYQPYQPYRSYGGN